MDFGLAGTAEQKTESKGEIWATPYYVAPENLNNEPEDFRSDIYSLGATLFQALAGRPPIEGETNSASALRELKNQPLVLAEVAPDISDETSRTIMRMLAPNPAQRLSSYAELIKALQRAKQALHGTSEQESARGRHWPAILGLIILCGVGFGAFLWWQKNADRGASAITAKWTQLGENASAEQRYEQARQELLAGKYAFGSPGPGELVERCGNSAAGAQLDPPASSSRGVYSARNRRSPKARSRRSRMAECIRQKRQTFLSRNSFSRRRPHCEATRLFPQSRRRWAMLIRSRHLRSCSFGLKDFELKDVAQAQQHLDQFIVAQPVAPFAWIKDYKAIAQKYLDDCRLYVAWKLNQRPRQC